MIPVTANNHNLKNTSHPNFGNAFYKDFYLTKKTSMLVLRSHCQMFTPKIPVANINRTNSQSGMCVSDSNVCFGGEWSKLATIITDTNQSKDSLANWQAHFTQKLIPQRLSYNHDCSKHFAIKFYGVTIHSNRNSMV